LPDYKGNEGSLLNRREFKKLAGIRIADAKALLKTGRNASGAYYLAGYAVECALKACIARKTKAGDWPAKPEEMRKMYSHSLIDLFALADLAVLRDQEVRNNPVFAGYWGAVKDWSEQKRYEESTQRQAEILFTAITDSQDGVLPWIQQYW
jgi:HEPN domain-containing protein